MHDYMKRIVLHHNLKAIGNGYKYYDMESILKQLISDDVHRQFPIKDSGYEMFLFLKRLTSYSDTVTLNVELYDSDYNEQPLNKVLTLFESDSEFRGWFTNIVNNFVEEVNQVGATVYYFDEFPGAYSVDNSKMLASIFDFTTGKFNELPEVKTTKITFEDPDVDKLIDQIMKE